MMIVGCGQLGSMLAEYLCDSNKSVTVTVCIVIERLKFVVLFTAIINTFKDTKNFISNKFKKEV